MPNPLKLSAFAVALLVLASTHPSARSSLVVTRGADPNATLVGAVRFTNFSAAGTEKEIWVGVPPLSAPPASEGADLSWEYGTHVTIAYRPETGVLTAGAYVYTGRGVPIDVAYLEKPIGYSGPLNYVEITLTTEVPNAHILLTGVLNPPGGNIFDSCRGCVSFPYLDQVAGTYKWGVTGVDLTQGFNFTGFISATHLAGPGAGDSVEFAFGFVPPPDTAGPRSSQLTIDPTPLYPGGPATLSALVDDSGTGNTRIAGASYTLDGVPGLLSAADGAFDEPSEQVWASLPASTLGTHQVCVQAVDALDNIGPPTCHEFAVTYKFTGFTNPIDNASINAAVAGQMIPVRWRLTDANDVPVMTDQQLVSYQIGCSEDPNEPVEPIEEYAGGSVGLLDQGDGNWQFNWKTLTSYANTCRAMFIAYGNRATSPVVKFRFR